MMVPTRASWQPSTFGIDDHEVLWTQTTEDDCFEQTLRWQWLIPCLLQLHPTKLTGWPHVIQFKIWLFNHSCMRSFDISMILSFDHTIMLLLIIRSFNHLIIRSLDHWIFNHSIIWLISRLFNHSIVQALDHAIPGSLDYRSLDPLKADYSILELTVANWLLQTQRLTLAEWLHLVFELFNEHLIQ